MKTLNYKILFSPLGNLKLVANDEALLALLWDNDRPNRVKLDSMVENDKNAILLETEKQLNEYFAEKRKVFDLPLQFSSGTNFQLKVWNLLNKIPFGKTLTYKNVAEEIGHPIAVRAVGAAVGRNPISIIVPCHRVIGSNKSLTGFAGGLDRKQILLDLEEIEYKI